MDHSRLNPCLYRCTIRFLELEHCIVVKKIQEKNPVAVLSSTTSIQKGRKSHGFIAFTFPKFIACIGRTLQCVKLQINIKESYFNSTQTLSISRTISKKKKLIQHTKTTPYLRNVINPTCKKINSGARNQQRNTYFRDFCERINKQLEPIFAHLVHINCKKCDYFNFSIGLSEWFKQSDTKPMNSSLIYYHSKYFGFLKDPRVCSTGIYFNSHEQSKHISYNGFCGENDGVSKGCVENKRKATKTIRSRTHLQLDGARDTNRTERRRNFMMTLIAQQKCFLF
eukprot:gnl/MRDRNA2_/MRDRNA2_84938_c0_seq2.p1 gnl/MRDRNA2_/MRDRNA2_84938_c0~~gnl/MRDRNA2_/MRDRNA2_84938_c0_seq2.p1  ORF type:complete len:330 (+),score=-20.84 gnl/MRDRNA2_/MRDRNA2_84938_c0_seq2:145-990(+)